MRYFHHINWRDFQDARVCNLVCPATLTTEAEAVTARIAHGDRIPTPSRLGRGRHPVTLPAQMAAKAAMYVAMCEARIS